MKYYTPLFREVRFALPDKDEQLLAEGKLSENFTLAEFTRSSTARRLGIDNTPDDEAIRGLNGLVDHVLQPARETLGMPLRITSGYRSPELNAAIHGAKRSDHLHGWAADVETLPETEANMRQLGLFIETECQFKQLIWEYGGEWIHVSRALDDSLNSCEILEAFRDSAGRTRYRAFTFKS